MRIRAARTDEAARIAAVHVASWREAYAGLLPAWMHENNTEVRRLRHAGFRSLALHVVARNPARRFYERLGARFIRAEPSAVAAADDGVAYGWDDIADVPTGTSVDGSTAGR